MCSRKRVCVQLGEKADLTPTEPSSVTPLCHLSLSEQRGFFPHWARQWAIVWILRGFSYVCLNDQVTKEINRKFVFSIFCETVFGVFRLVVSFLFVWGIFFRR